MMYRKSKREKVQRKKINRHFLSNSRWNGSVRKKTQTECGQEKSLSGWWSKKWRCKPCKLTRLFQKHLQKWGDAYTSLCFLLQCCVFLVYDLFTYSLVIVICWAPLYSSCWCNSTVLRLNFRIRTVSKTVFENTQWPLLRYINTILSHGIYNFMGL